MSRFTLIGTPPASPCAPVRCVFLRLALLRARRQLYLLRWLRLLFGREFHMEDASVVWDALFAYGLEGKDGEDTLLTLVDDFAVAMLMYVFSSMTPCT